ncbi:MAG: hypothetical protein M9894_22455 [Planctomycetes bacterium]|nr:hypothetical protein [Planctomycetota bacterium]
MRPRRLRRRTIPWSLASLLVPILATGWLVISELRDEPRAPSGPTLVRPPVPPAERPAARPPGKPGPDLPDDLLLVRLAAEPTVGSAEARHVVQGAEHSPAARYAALRRLEGLTGPAAVEEAEALVLGAAPDADGRFLAVNALGVLARSPEGRAALARCAERAPDASLRQAARTLLRRAP